MGENSLVYVRYRTRGYGKDRDPKYVYPVTIECMGWLDYEDSQFVRVVFERHVRPTAEAGLATPIGTSVAIPKKDIINMQVLGVSPKLLEG